MSKDESRFAKLSEQQKWEWHAEVYAFRHVVMGRVIDEPTPCDEGGEWYSEALVKAAVDRKRAKRKSGKVTAEAHTATLEGRAAINGWARRKGYSDVDAYIIAKGVGWEDAYRLGMHEIIAEIVASKALKEPRHPRRALDDIRADLGLSARDEPTRPPASWTAEQMAAGRRALGLETP